MDTILQVHKYYWPRDGASNYMLYLSKLLQARGCAVVPFAMNQKQTLPSRYKKFFVSEMNLSDPGRATLAQKIMYAGRMIYSREARRQMRRLLDETRIDIAHLHNIYHHISPSILPVLKKKKIPIVMTLHDYKLLTPNYSMFHHGAVHEEDARGWYVTCIKHKCLKNSRIQSAIVTAEMIWHHKIMRYYERYVDRFIAPSRFMMDICIRMGWPREKFVHIPHPIDIEHVALRSEDRGYVLYLGRLSEEKGIHTLIDAAKKTPEIPYRIVGDGPIAAALHARVDSEHINNVLFDGFQTGDALKKRITGARITVVPSVWYENYPLSILEAKASGKIVIGSNIGGIPELLSSDALFPPGDADALARRILFWYNQSSARRLTIEKKQRREVETINNPDTHVDAILSLYAELMHA